MLLTAKDTLLDKGTMNWNAGLSLGQGEVIRAGGNNLEEHVRTLKVLGLIGSIPAVLADLRRLNLDDAPTGSVPAGLVALANLRFLVTT